MTSDNIYLLNFKPEQRAEANLVLTPRRDILGFSENAGQLKEILRRTCLEKDIEIVSGKMTANYLHLLIAFPRALAVKEAVEHIKRSSSEKILSTMPGLSAPVGASFWADEYMAILSESTLSDIFLSDTINNYIRHIEEKRGKIGRELKTGEASKHAKVLVTGGAGFIGSNLVDELVSRNYEVVVIDSLVTGKIEYINPQAKFYKADILSDKLAGIFEREKFDFVFHLAAQIDVRKSVADPVEDNKTNVLGSLNLLENAHKSGVKKIIFMSSGGAVYSYKEELPVREGHEEKPVSPYGIHKLTFEKYLNYYHKVYGMNYLALRPSNAYGPRQYKGGEAGVISIFIDNAITGKKITIHGDGTKTRDFVYVTDIVDAAIASIHTDYVGEINISSCRESSILDIVRYIEEAMGNPVKKFHGDDKKGEAMRSSLDNSRAKEILGWEPKVGLKEGIKRTIDWANRVAKGGSM